MTDVDERDLQMFGEDFVNGVLAYVPEICKDSSELATGALLLRQRALELLIGDELVLEQQLADVRAKVLSGEFPNDSIALGERLVTEKILT